MKVAYIGEYHPTAGTYYRQRITVNQAEYNYINERMTEIYSKTLTDSKQKHIITGAQMEILTYGKPLDQTDRNGNKIYLKITQLLFIKSFFPENKRITINNTILYIRGK